MGVGDICFKKQNCSWSSSPSPIISFFSNTAVFTRMAYHYFSKYILTYCSSNHSHQFQQLSEIYIYFSQCSSAQVFPWCFAFPLNAIQPCNSLLFVYKWCLICPGIQLAVQQSYSHLAETQHSSLVNPKTFLTL